MINQEDILQTGNLELLARHAVEGFITGFHKSPFHGFSVEFAEHRQYNSGESIRHLDWRLYGRTDKLFVKRYEEETNLRCRILIDSSSSMQLKTEQGLSKLQYSAWCAATFITLLKKQRDAAGISTFDNEIVYSSNISSSGRHYRALMSELSNLLHYKSEQKGTDISTILHQVADQMHKRSMIVLFTDLLTANTDHEALFDAIQHLKHNKHELIIFNTLDFPSELELDYGKQVVSFQDLETGERVRVQPNEVQEMYSERVKSYLKELKLKCSQYKVDFVEADTSKGVEFSMIPFLVKRNRISR